jgi:hypothetical protein
MEEIRGTYRDFKESLDQEFKRTAEGFVKIGYLLKIARDTEILRESGYHTVAEFAQAEYGLTKDIVSRYIAINDRYSEGGYSEKLQIRYQGFGVAKLAEMLTLPNTVIDSISPELTKAEIRDIKREIKEEEQISDIEVLLEVKRPEAAADLPSFFWQYFYENRQAFASLKNVIEGTGNQIEGFLDVLAPSGVALKSTRVKGVGKLMLSIRGRDRTVDLLDVRNDEKQTYSWEELLRTLRLTFKKGGPEAWEEIFGESFEVPDAQVPGQMEIGDYPDVLPDNKSPEMAKSPREKEISPKKQPVPSKPMNEQKEIQKVAPAQQKGVKNEPKTKETEETEPSTESVNEPEIIEKPFGCRKDYLDTLTTYGAADYLSRSMKETEKRKIESLAFWEEWLLKEVDNQGREMED